MRRLTILGSTGSIGRQTLEIVGQNPSDLQVVGLAARKDRATLADQMMRFRPRWAALTEALPPEMPGIDTRPGLITEMVTDPSVDLVVVAMVGAAGLEPTLSALRAGKTVALANKEALVMAGPVIKEQLKHGGELIPIDSEHSAIWQCLQGESPSSIEKLVLTASGGAFRDHPIDDLRDVTPEQALRHPNWSMGQKVTIDSATLMNKGLEVIEASILFDLEVSRIHVILHRESIVHSLVYFRDTSVKAQLGLPDMRLPIQYALSHPGRWPNQLDRLDLTDISTLNFAPIHMDRYPCLRLAMETGMRGGSYPAALCAADEVAVEQFLLGALAFSAIPELIEAVISRHEFNPVPTHEDITEIHSFTRRQALELLSTYGAALGRA